MVCSGSAAKRAPDSESGALSLERERGNGTMATVMARLSFGSSPRSWRTCLSLLLSIPLALSCAASPAASPTPPPAPTNQSATPTTAPTRAAAPTPAATRASAGSWQVFAGDRTAPADLNTPTGIALDAQGNVYVADTGNNRIQKLSPTGQPLAQWGTEGNAPGQLRYPDGIALDAQGNIYVADWANGRIQKLSLSGQ